MKPLLEIKINKFHYKRLSKTELWINQSPEDPMEVCATSEELASKLQESADKVRKRLKEVEHTIKTLDKETERLK